MWLHNRYKLNLMIIFKASIWKLLFQLHINNLSFRSLMPVEAYSSTRNIDYYKFTKAEMFEQIRITSLNNSSGKKK